MPTLGDGSEELGLELLRIKAAISQNTYSEKDLEVYRFCLANGGNLAVIAAGYTLSENLVDLKESAIQVVQKRLREIGVSGTLPSRWAELAVLEGLLFADAAILLSIKLDIIRYLKRLAVEPAKMADLSNASALLHRLDRLGVKQAAHILRRIEGASGGNPEQT